MKNILHWGRKVQDGNTVQSSYYDHTYYTVPVTGTVNIAKIHQALRDKYFPPHHNVFGGYCSLGSITDNGNGSVRVEVIYHIGE
jgi:hypothetical protein